LNTFTTFVLIFSLLILFTAVISSVICIILAIAKKKHRVLDLIQLIGYPVGIVLFVIGGSNSLLEIMRNMSLIPLFLLPYVIIVFIIKTVKKTLKPWLWSFVPLLIVLCPIFYSLTNFLYQREIRKMYANHELNEIKIQVDYDFEMVDGDEPLEVLTSTGFGTSFKSNYKSVFDISDNDKLLDKTGVTAEECIQAIENSTRIDAKFKPMFVDFVNRIAEAYPDACLDMLYNNLSTLEIHEVSAREYLKKSWSTDSLGVYRLDENTIYIPEGTEYVEGNGEFGFQVIIHEFCHVCRNSWFDSEDGAVHNKLQFDSAQNTLLGEAMNSVFSCSLLHYYEWDIAYQIPSNYLRIMLECMDNYELTDYMNHSDNYFLSCLDQYMGDTNYSTVIWKLIALQREDYANDKIDIPAEDYTPIYDYLCEMYYEKYITEDMTNEQMRKIADELVTKAFYDVPKNYKEDKDYFYEYLESHYYK